jgi:CubicO group peptidase (beta-lactamase class C family)
VLLEEARFRLADPVGDYLPELARMKVMTGGTAEKPLLADAQKPITIKDLFTHSSGLIYGFGGAPIDKIYRDAKVEESTSLADFVSRVSRLPLAHEPGTRFSYGLSTDVLARSSRRFPRARPGTSPGGRAGPRGRPARQSHGALTA